MLDDNISYTALGDFEERFHNTASKKGQLSAFLFYWGQVILLVPSFHIFDSMPFFPYPLTLLFTEKMCSPAGETSRNELYLRPLNRIHLYANVNWEFAVVGSINNIYIFTAISIFVLPLQTGVLSHGKGQDLKNK